MNSNSNYNHGWERIAVVLPRKEEQKMRVEAYTQVQQMYKTNTAKKSEKSSPVSFHDQLEISSMGKDIQIAKQAVTSSPDVREDVIAPIKAGIQNGTYAVAEESFAEKLIQKYEETQLF